ncbi:diguanylate cyclase [uncultured Paracoccus sp.]|uniref:diguanylate cyclase n=1 Tax=uncultured Paracoccus sp. TaxID=189685 RepID=UPI002614702E|nr:diguanylate cyclase [uncultured Paracoccus sp.]
MIGDALVVLNQFGLVSICSLMAGGLIRRTGPGHLRSTLLGLIFGIGCCTAMLSPLHLQEGVFFDLRSLFIGLSTGLFGLVAGTATVVVAILFRVQIGGDGVVIGVSSMVVSFVVSVVWRRAFASLVERDADATIPLALLGLSMSAYLVVALIWPDYFLRALSRGYLHYVAIGNVVGMVFLGSLLIGALRTISMERKFSRLAMRDPLTGLLNRRGLSVAYEKWQAVAPRDAGAVVISADIDQFKAFNESHGHQVGDRCLIAVAEAMRRVLHSGDLAARVGGDEFVMILRDVAPEDSRRVMERVCHQIAGITVDLGGGTRLPVTLTFGSHYARSQAALQDGLNLSDLLMMKEKQQRRAPVTHGNLAVVASA